MALVRELFYFCRDAAYIVCGVILPTHSRNMPQYFFIRTTVKSAANVLTSAKTILSKETGTHSAEMAVQSVADAF